LKGRWGDDGRWRLLAIERFSEGLRAVSGRLPAAEAARHVGKAAATLAAPIADSSAADELESLSAGRRDVTAW
jgi:hypothetical protein